MTSDAISLIVIDILNNQGISYMLVGSLSTNYHSTIRSTKDADIVLQSNLADTAWMIAREYSDLTVDPQYGFESVTGTTKLLLRSASSPFTVELFGLSDDPHDQLRFARRKCVDWEGRQAWVASAEDAVITKLRWALTACREKDITDARIVIAFQNDVLDWPYVEGWCDQHGSRPLLEKLREEAQRR